jgi:hypothetical protein
MADVRIEIVGLIWRRATNDIVFSVHIGGSSEITYLEIPKFSAHLCQQAALRGIGVGDICDEVNAALNEAERERIKASGLPFVELEFQMTPEQARAWAEWFEDDEPGSSE